ncbi:hypothetical protein CRUP_008846 [Coryphaenoides rupestris]|nr:hypothetical protein CRUP_008846 [Coryphaenoides rupestris]
MPGDLVPLPVLRLRLRLLLLLVLCVFQHAVHGAARSQGCLPDPASAYRYTGAVCRLTYPAAVVLNEKTTKVIEAAFQHARYPRMTGEKSIPFIGTVKYGLDNLEIHNLTIGQSEFDLRPTDGISMKISNVSAVFRGTIHYGYGSWLVNVAHSVDFEIESQIDLGINPRLYCGEGKVSADTSDCYLEFHKLRLQLQGDKEPNWLKKLFTDFITFTVKLVVKGQGLTNYNNISAVINESVFNPSQLTEDKMLYFWISDQLLNPMVAAAHQDGRFHLNVSGTEITRLWTQGSKNRPLVTPELLTRLCKELQELQGESPCRLRQQSSRKQEQQLGILHKKALPFGASLRKEYLEA